MLTIDINSIQEVTNFFDDPDSIRNNGLQQQYRSWSIFHDKGTTWSGYRATYGINNNKIEQDIRKKLETVCDRSIKRLNLNYHINPRVSRQGFPHCDIPSYDPNASNSFAGVIYLNKNESLPTNFKINDFGTTIYNYTFDAKKEKIDFDKMKIMYEANLGDHNRFKDIFSEELTLIKNELEVVKKVKFEYNKLICYPSYILHSPDFYFGENIEDSRMTICIHGEFNAK